MVLWFAQAMQYCELCVTCSLLKLQIAWAVLMQACMMLRAGSALAHDHSAAVHLGEDFQAQLLSALAELLHTAPAEDADSRFRSGCSQAVPAIILNISNSCSDTVMQNPGCCFCMLFWVLLLHALADLVLLQMPPISSDL